MRTSAIAALQGRIEHLDHSAPFRAGLVPAKAEIAHQLAELLEPPKIFVLVVLAEFHQQHRIGRTAHELLERRPEHRDVARQLDHGAIDQFHGNGLELDDVLGGIHRLVETAEMAGADCAAAEHRRQLQFDLGREAERAFRPDQDMREIEIVAARREGVEIVAADPALDLGEARVDLVGLALADREQIARQSPQRRVCGNIGEVGADRAEMRAAAVSQQRVDRDHVLARIAVAQRARAAGIVAGHAADGGARGGRDIDRKPQAVRFQRAVEIVEHDARLDHAAASRCVELENVVQIFRAIHHQRMVDGLPALRGAAAARQHADALFARDRYRPIGFLDRCAASPRPPA